MFYLYTIFFTEKADRETKYMLSVIVMHITCNFNLQLPAIRKNTKPGKTEKLVWMSPD